MGTAVAEVEMNGACRWVLVCARACCVQGRGGNIETFEAGPNMEQVTNLQMR